MDFEQRDYRHFKGVGEVRAFDDDEGRAHIAGTAIVFGRQSVDLGGFVEVVHPEVEIRFSDDLVSLFNHDPNVVLGRVPNTLTVERTDDGIVYDVTPPMSAAHITELIGRGDVSGNSFQFMTKRDRWERLPFGGELRTLLEIEVRELGPVVFPAYRDTDVSVAMRSRDQALAPGLSAFARRRREIDLVG